MKAVRRGRRDELDRHRRQQDIAHHRTRNPRDEQQGAERVPADGRGGIAQRDGYRVARDR
jgi:hypothetical protein